MGSQTFIPRDYEVFAGLDVDKKSISVTFTDHQGLLKSMRMPYSVDHLVNHVRKHYGDKKVAFAYEAGPTGYGLMIGKRDRDTFLVHIESGKHVVIASDERLASHRSASLV